MAGAPLTRPLCPALPPGALLQDALNATVLSVRVLSGHFANATGSLTVQDSRLQRELCSGGAACPLVAVPHAHCAPSAARFIPLVGGILTLLAQMGISLYAFRVWSRVSGRQLFESSMPDREALNLFGFADVLMPVQCVQCGRASP